MHDGIRNAARITPGSAFEREGLERFLLGFEAMP
jgi:hypothetical protein